MTLAIAFEPGGVEVNVVELNGAIDFTLRIKPVLVDGARFFTPHLRIGFDPDPPDGLFYVPPVSDRCLVPEVPDLFSVARFAAAPDGDDPV